MKIKHHIVFTVGNVKVSRTYGGCNYTVSVYENKGRGRLVYLGERTACTRGHKGSDHEAWSAALNASPALTRAAKRDGLSLSYFDRYGGENKGWMVQRLGHNPVD